MQTAVVELFIIRIWYRSLARIWRMRFGASQETSVTRQSSPGDVLESRSWSLHTRPPRVPSEELDLEYTRLRETLFIGQTHVNRMIVRQKGIPREDMRYQPTGDTGICNEARYFEPLMGCWWSDN